MASRARPLVAIVLLALCATAARAEGADAVDQFVRGQMERQKVPGLAVAIVKQGEVIKAAGYGYANVEHRVPVGPETIFQSGSLGKQFTSALVMTLVEDGSLALEDPVSRYLVGSPEGWKPITVRHLLTHTSGIPDYATDSLDYRRDYTEEELVRLAFTLPLEFPAGSRWSYSNTGYLLLGAIVRRATGRFYGDVLRERVFEPLGMKTARIISEEDIVPNRAAGYRLVGGVLKNQEWVAPQINTTADGSLYLSLLDLIAWDRGLRAGAILRPASWERVFEPVRLASGRSYPYGFGWSLEEIAGQKVQRHGGAWQGFRTHLARYLGDGLTIIVLANLAEAEPEKVVDGIAAILDPDLRTPAPSPIRDREPAVTARLKRLLADAAAGNLSPDELAHVRAGFFPDVARGYQELLRDLGPPRRVTLLERRELGDDRIYSYRVGYRKKTLRVRLGLAPDDKVSLFQIESN